MNILLVTLLLMNMYWYYLLIKILIGKTKGHSSDRVGKAIYEGSGE